MAKEKSSSNSKGSSPKPKPASASSKGASPKPLAIPSSTTSSTRRKRDPKRASSASPNEHLDATLKELGIAPNDWDFLLVGDGSGSTIEKPCGWAAVGFERTVGTPEIFCGAANKGSVNFAEIMPYLQALHWYLGKIDKRQESGAPKKAHKVHILSDSKYVVETGPRPLHAGLKKNRGLWVAIDMLERQGLVIKWHWRARDTSVFNRFADMLSRGSRLLLEDADMINLLTEDMPLT